MSLFAELRRRNVVRVGLAYAVVGWVLAQIAEFAFENFGAPEWVLKTFIALLLLGLPIALFFAWAFELTPEGIKREKEVDRSQSIVNQTGRKLDFIIIGTLTIALAFVVWDKYLPSIGDEAAPEATAKLESSIAVLPFLNMSSDPDQEYFADGMTEEILNTLAAIKDLRVAGRTSSFMFKERTDVDFQTIGEMLNVAYVLEGSVRKSGNKLRITAQLIAAESGYHLWSETYDREITDIFVIQEELATAIGQEMQIKLGVEVAESIDDRKLGEQAMEAWLRGRSQYRAAEYEAAQDSFEEVIEIEPGYLPVYPQLVWVASGLLETGAIAEQAFHKVAQELLATVNEIDPESKEALRITIEILYFLRDYQGVAETFRKLSTIGDDPQRLMNAAEAEYILGNSDRALELFREYLVAEPLDYAGRASYARALAGAGRLTEAENELARLMLIAPDHIGVLHTKSHFHAYYSNEQAEGIKWRLVVRDKYEVRDSGGDLLVRMLLDLGDAVAARNWAAADAGLSRDPAYKLHVEYLLARYDDDTAKALDVAHQIGEAVAAMADIEEYHTDFDWLRLLQRQDPDFAFEIYRKRAPQLTTSAPKVLVDIGSAISLADLYMQTNETALAHDLLDQSLKLLTSRPEHFHRPATTMIYALKGDVPNALKELRASIDANYRWEWWLLEKDHAYEILWDEPEFKAMMDELRADMGRQRAELHAMIESGEIDLTPSRASD